VPSPPRAMSLSLFGFFFVYFVSCSCMELWLITIASEQGPRHPLQLLASTVQIVAASLCHSGHLLLESFTGSPSDPELFGEVVPSVVYVPPSTNLDTQRDGSPACSSDLFSQPAVLIVLGEMPLGHVLFPGGGELNPGHCFQLIGPYHTIRTNL